MPLSGDGHRAGRLSPAGACVLSIALVAIVLAALEATAPLIGRSLGLSSFESGLYLRDPDRLWRLVPDYSGVLAGGEVIRTNASGFRGPPVRERKGSVRRILVLGDSIAFGLGVPEDSCWPRILESMANSPGKPPPETEVVNGGVIGYGTFQEDALLKASGPRLKPDIVILQFSPNDLIENGTYRRLSPWRIRIERSNLFRLVGKIRERMRDHPGERVDRPAEEFQRKRSRTVARKEFGVSKAEVAFSDSNPELLVMYWRRTADAVGRVRADTRAIGADLVGVVFPSPNQVRGMTGSTAFQDSIRSICHRLDIPLIDLLDPFRRVPDRYRGTHPTGKGHRVAAARIWRAIESRTTPSLRDRPRAP